MIFERPPLRAREPLHLGGGVIGSIEPAVARLLQAQQLLHPQGHGWQVVGALDAVALALRDAGMLGAWRHEALSVHTAEGTPVGQIERAAVRALGIATRAVHLHGRLPDGRAWVQLRAHTKANDPGLWDTLMGGMVSAADTLEQALARETWEEAGLRLEQLHHLAHAGVVHIRRPSGGADGVGYTVERIDWFACTVPEGVEPHNQDGEVERFEAVPMAPLRHGVAQGHYTLEAALILAPDLVQA